jgi:tetratricopeptide (TPR) repeat protein
MRFNLGKALFPARFLSAILLLAGLNFFGCQGCRSGSSRDIGSADSILRGDPQPGAIPEGPGTVSSPNSFPEVRREKELISKIEFLENEKRRIYRSIPKGRARDEAALIRLVLAAFQKERAEHTGDPRYRVLLGMELLRRSEAYPQARDHFEKALEADPSLYPAWKGVALSWIKEDRGKAREALERLRDPKVPGPWGWILIGEFFEAGGKFSEAEKYYREGASRFPKSVHPYLQLLQLHGMQEQWESAFHSSEMAQERAPNSQRVWFFEGRLRVLRAMKALHQREVLEHKNLAVQALKKSRDIDPGTEIAILAGDLLFRIQDPSERFRNIALDPKAPLDERHTAIQILVGKARNSKFDFWKKVIALPERPLRFRGLNGVAVHGGEEAVDVLAKWIQDKDLSVMERSQVVSCFAIVQTIDSRAPVKYMKSAVPGLIGGFRLCMANRLEADSEEESLLFQDLLDLLGKWTGKNFGEGRDHADPEAMKMTILQWEEWWNRRGRSGD